MSAAIIDAFFVMSASLFLIAIAVAGAAAVPWTDQERDETLDAFRMAQRLIVQAWRHPGISPAPAGRAPAAPTANSVVEPLRWQVPGTSPAAGRCSTWHGVTVP